MARVFTYVLSYDDLLKPRTRSFVLPERTPVTIGRASSDDAEPGFASPNEWRVGDRWMSSGQALIEPAGEDDFISDVGSRNGTFVNRKKISKQKLLDGDLIEVGHSLLCYRVVENAMAGLVIGNEPPRLGPTPTFCPEIAWMVADLARIAPSTEAVLLLAESGAGKQIASEMIHARSGRTGSFGVIDCAAVPEKLLGATFFGPGGEIQRAAGGTLLLDGVANLSVAAQAKLQKVIESGTDNVRFIAASNRDLFETGSGFRPDLLRRLSGYIARIPPLRNRREDLGVLSAYLLADEGVTRQAITAPAGRKLFASSFPGNVRQLRTVLRAAAIRAGNAPIEVAHLGRFDAPKDGRTEIQPLEVDTAAVKKPTRVPDAAEVDAALTGANGNVIRAAQTLGIRPIKLARWLETHDFSLDKFQG